MTKGVEKQVEIELRYKNLVVPVNATLALKDNEDERTLTFSVTCSERIEESEFTSEFRFCGSEEYREKAWGKLSYALADDRSALLARLADGWNANMRLPRIVNAIANLLSTSVVFDAFVGCPEFVRITDELSEDKEELVVTWRLLHAERQENVVTFREFKTVKSVIVLEAAIVRDRSELSVGATAYSAFEFGKMTFPRKKLTLKGDFDLVENDSKILIKNISRFIPDLDAAFSRLKEIVIRHTGQEI